MAKRKLWTGTGARAAGEVVVSEKVYMNVNSARKTRN